LPNISCREKKRRQSYEKDNFPKIVSGIARTESSVKNATETVKKATKPQQHKEEEGD